MGTATMERIDEQSGERGDGWASVSLAGLEERICQGAANLTAAETAWLLDVAEFDRRQGWAVDGLTSCAAWLAWQVGLDARAAREKVRVANALVEFPAVAEAMATGQLTYSKARALTRIAAADNVAELVDLAIAMTSNQLERFVAAVRRCDPDLDTADDSALTNRAVHVSRSDGAMTLSVTLPMEAGQSLLAVIDSFVAADPTSTPTQRRADALVALAEHAAIPPHVDRQAARPRYLATLHLDEQGYRSLTSSEEPETGCCSVAPGDRGLADATPVAHATARRMLCDAVLDTAVRDRQGNPLFAGRSTRTINRRLRRALLDRDGACRFPGCTHRGWLDAHHLVHWIDGGPTDIHNLLLLCRRHHRFVHEHRWTIHGQPGGDISFRRPDGTHLTSVVTPPNGDPTAIDRHHRRAEDGRCRWQGDPLHLGYAVANHLANQQLRRAPRAS